MERQIKILYQNNGRVEMIIWYEYCMINEQQIGMGGYMTIRELTTFNLDTILNLYSSVGWTNYTDKPGMVKKAYENSLLTLGAYDGDNLIGVIRTVGDGFSRVFVQDILGSPEYQRKGIGTQLLQEVMKRFSSVYQIGLMTDNTPKTISFYQSIGFVKADDMGCCAFIKM